MNSKLEKCLKINFNLLVIVGTAVMVASQLKYLDSAMYFKGFALACIGALSKIIWSEMSVGNTRLNADVHKEKVN